jgi:hypothetical protein
VRRVSRADEADTAEVAEMAWGQPIALYDYNQPTVRARSVNRSLGAKWLPAVTDDLPKRIPITDDELDIVEAHFSDLLDELLGPRC